MRKAEFANFAPVPLQDKGFTDSDPKA